MDIIYSVDESEGSINFEELDIGDVYRVTNPDDHAVYVKTSNAEGEDNAFDFTRKLPRTISQKLRVIRLVAELHILREV